MLPSLNVTSKALDLVRQIRLDDPSTLVICLVGLLVLGIIGISTMYGLLSRKQRQRGEAVEKRLQDKLDGRDADSERKWKEIAELQRFKGLIEQCPRESCPYRPRDKRQRQPEPA